MEFKLTCTLYLNLYPSIKSKHTTYSYNLTVVNRLILSLCISVILCLLLKRLRDCFHDEGSALWWKIYQCLTFNFFCITTNQQFLQTCKRHENTAKNLFWGMTNAKRLVLLVQCSKIKGRQQEMSSLLLTVSAPRNNGSIKYTVAAIVSV